MALKGELILLELGGTEGLAYVELSIALEPEVMEPGGVHYCGVPWRSHHAKGSLCGEAYSYVWIIT